MSDKELLIPASQINAAINARTRRGRIQMLLLLISIKKFWNFNLW